MSTKSLGTLLSALLTLSVATNAAEKKIVLVAGSRSHGAGEHEFRAGCLLLQKWLNQTPGVSTVLYSNGWPADAKAFEGAASIFIYSDGGGGHPIIADRGKTPSSQGSRLKIIGELMDKGVGLGCAHYAVEIPKDVGGPELLQWIGGYFEMYHSVNPTWEADFKSFPDHPITRGVKPFKIRDEWYYHMRFPEGMKNVTPILTALPPDSTRGKPGANETHGGNPDVQAHKGEPEHVMWSIERPDGGRGFGFTGGHFHKNWGDENFRKLVLNAILWTAKVEVPTEGASASSVTGEELKSNLDDKGQKEP